MSELQESSDGATSKKAQIAICKAVLSILGKIFPNSSLGRDQVEISPLQIKLKKTQMTHFPQA